MCLVRLVLAALGGAAITQLIWCATFGSDAPAPVLRDGAVEASSPRPGEDVAGGDADAASCDCPLGDCIGGKCTYTVLADGQALLSDAGSPTGLESDGTRVYWTTGPSGTIRVRQLVGDPTIRDYRIDEGAHELAVGDGMLYWNTRGQIFRCAIGDACAIPEKVADAPTGAQQLRVFDGYLYWAVAASDQILRRRLDAGADASDASAVLADDSHRSVRYDVTDRDLYYEDGTPPRRVRRCPLSTPCPTALTTQVLAEVAAPSGIAADDGGVYYATDGGLRYCPVDRDCTKSSGELIGPARGDVRDMLFRDGTLWVALNDPPFPTGLGTIVRAQALDAGTLDVVTEDASVDRVILTNDLIVWSVPAAGRIMASRRSR